MNKNVLENLALIEKQNFEDAWTVQMLRDTLKYDYNYMFVLTDDRIEILNKDNILKELLIDNVQGYIICNSVAGESELLRIAIEDNYKGQGYSKLLMNAYFEKIDNECERYFLEVRSKNKVARALYEKYAYTQMGIRKKYYTNPTDDAVIYSKTK